MVTTLTGERCLSGIVYNHPSIADGRLITTTALLGKTGDLVVTKSGSVYDLRESHGYADAGEKLLYRKALFDSLEEIDIHTVKDSYLGLIRPKELYLNNPSPL
jgi:hypothetical protein